MTGTATSTHSVMTTRAVRRSSRTRGPAGRPGTQGGEDRADPAEEVGYADQVGHDEVAVQAGDRHQLLEQLDVHQHDGEDQRFVVRHGEQRR